MIQTVSARVAIALATQMGWEAGDDIGSGNRGSGYSHTSGHVAHGIDCGQVLAAVDRQEPAVRDWLLVAYACPGYVGLETAHRVRGRLQEAVAVAHDCRSKKLPEFVTAAMSVYIERAMDGQRRTSEVTREKWLQCARLAGLNMRHKARWEPRQQTVEQLISRWEASGLNDVRKTLTCGEEAA
ncbi:hypothetical protein [Halorhodospira sp. 9622]|uniref:hypothetical protein n=1 Tax=Halorhodospira sp. 9622 TaxID=2899136 RepID=UPI001EE7EAB0|nr:hypothetical protein [Halorhodospira sp. 9622]MCG5538967.1 hypothetical protein [Halorhodospira sp. 9622]